MITFEALREVAGAEKRAQKPAKLPEHFFAEVRAYLRQQLPPLERESAMVQLQEILDLRDKKILSLAFFFVRSGVKPDQLTPEEQKLFDQLVAAVRSYHQERKERMEGPEQKTRVIAFLQDVPAFVGLDLRTYGPFRSGDIATLPEPEAALLAGKGAGREISVGGREV